MNTIENSQPAIACSPMLHSAERSLWKRPPGETVLPRGEIHAWRIIHGALSSRSHELIPLLSPGECEIASSCCFPKHREAYILSRGVLRLILSRYSGTPPERLCFRCGAYGKPELVHEDGFSRTDLRFNLSHTGGMTLLAVTRTRRVGIDVESLSAHFDPLKLASRYFLPEESAWLKSQPAYLHHSSFLWLWTRKEAYLKATGEGLSRHLCEVNALSGLGETARKMDKDSPSSAEPVWSIVDLLPGPEYVASLAVEGCPNYLLLWDYSAP